MNGLRRIIRMALLLALAAGGVALLGAKAWAWPWQKRAHGGTKLEDVIKSPKAYLGRKVTIKCRFAMRGKLFKDFNTRFNTAEHANFAVWRVDARLWNKKERRDVLPTLYLNKSVIANLRALNGLKRYDLIEVTGRVVSSYAGLPWIYVDALRKLAEPENAINDISLVHTRRGLALLAAGKAAVAARQLEMAFAAGVAKCHQAFLKHRLAKAYRGSGRLREARKVLGEVLELKPDDAGAYYELAELELELKNADEVVKNCRRVFELSTSYPQAHALLAEAYGMQGQTAAALQECDLAAETPALGAKDKAMVEVRRARVLIHARKYADAVRAYAKAISAGTLGGEAWLRKEIGELYESRYDATGDAKNLAEAAREYANANVLSNNADKRGLFLAARVAFKRAKAEQSGDFSKAKEGLDQCLGLDADYGPAQVLRARIALAEGDKAMIKKCVAGLLARASDNVPLLLEIAASYEKEKMLAEAETLYCRIAEAAPQNTAALEKHADLALRLGHVRQAKQSLAALVDLHPRDASYALRLGRIHFQQGSYATAGEILAVAAAADGPQAEEAGLLLGRSRALAGNVGGAEDALREVLKRFPASSEAAGRLAMLLADSGSKPSEALQLARKASAANPGASMYTDILGWAQLAAGQPAEAVKTLEGIGEKQRSRLTWYHLASAKFRAGDLAGARTAAVAATSPERPGEIKAVVAAVRAKARKLLAAIDKARKQAEQDALRRQRRAEARKARQEARERRQALAGRKRARQKLEQERCALEKEAEPIRHELEKIEVKGMNGTEDEPAAAPTDERKPVPAPLPTKAQARKDDGAGKEKRAQARPVSGYDRARDLPREGGGRPRIAEVKLARKPAAVGKEPVIGKGEPGIEIVEIPGVMEPDFSTPAADISTMSGPARNRNSVRNLPTPAAAPRMSPSPVASPVRRRPLADKPGADKRPAPVTALEPRPRKVAPVGQEHAHKSEPGKQAPAMPTNDIDALPDWAK